MKFIYIAFNFKIFLFLIQIFSTLSILSEVNNEVIELNKDDFQKEFNEIKNKYILRVKGNIKAGFHQSRSCSYLCSDSAGHFSTALK